MRTNIELNDDLVQEARRYSTARTKKALIEEALTTFIQVRAEERRTAAYADRLQALQGRLASLRLRDSSLDVLRQDRLR